MGEIFMTLEKIYRRVLRSALSAEISPAVGNTLKNLAMVQEGGNSQYVNALMRSVLLTAEEKEFLKTLKKEK
jgi:hypothetical protein